MYSMKIKRVNLLSPEAQNTLSALQQICLPYDRPYKTNAGYWWVVSGDGHEPIGFAGLVPSTRWADTGYLCRAGVVADCRGKGIQKKLIRVRIRQAKVNGWRWLITDTFENPASSNSLIAMGFKLFEPSVPWGAKGTLYWRLKLKD
jgi:GNAT superfamily N-acetyltransferase